MSKLVINFPGKKKEPPKDGKHCAYCGSALHLKWIVSDEKKYHPSCFKDFVQPKCVICGEAIEGKYYKDEFGNNAHTVHHGRETRHCCYCNRIISKGHLDSGVMYARPLCHVCNETAITSFRQVRPKYDHVLGLFRKNGINGTPAGVPVNLVNSIHETSGHSSKVSAGITRTKVTRYGSGRVEKVHEIDILTGMPALEFSAVLAHELLHVWLNENDITLPTNAQTEGFCNLGAHLIYTEDGSKLSEILLNRMHKNYDLVYGAGYRNMLSRLKSAGWNGLIKEIQGNRKG